MAMIFELWAECKTVKASQCFMRHFEGHQHTLVTGRMAVWHAGLEKVYGVTGISVDSRELNRYGIANEKDAIEQEEAELRLYHRLLTAPQFSYAYAARLASHHAMEDLQEFLLDTGNGQRILERDCVIADDVWHTLGQPVNCRPFRPGYWSFLSEHQWSKLFEVSQSPELLRLRRELFAA
ncbi:hypothetical protein [Anatilimnocola floriformis]|uniref:hypothetical protein n=1 Tax=Anatilimnocola floriformis TaxID=2948575 RepID=UPI0020C55745|nr:hypothetical protein [Anatilimnocola floriformis]